MSTEEIKMVVDMIATLGEGGKEAFMWWLLATQGVGLLKSLVGITAFVSVFLYGIRTFGSLSPAQSAVAEMRDASCIGCAGPLFSGEINAVKRRFMEMLRNEDK